MGQFVDGADEQGALGHLDAFVQALDAVVGQHRHGLLGENASGVDAGVHLEHRGAGDLDAVRQGVAGAMHARKAGQQGRVGVDRAAPEAAQKSWADQFHEAGQHHQIDVVSSHLAGEFGVPGGAVTALDERVHEGGHPRLLGAPQPLRRVVVGTHHDHRGVQRVVGLSIEQRLQQAAGA